MPSRTTEGGTYRYGFNGKETDHETGIQDYGMRWYLPNIARFPSVDPITKEYPELTPYQFASNTPIQAIDLDGLEKLTVTMRAFIPYKNVKLDITHASENTNYQLAVHGDGARKFIYDLKSAGYGTQGNEGYRVEFQINLDLDRPSGTDTITKTNVAAGQTSIFLLAMVREFSFFAYRVLYLVNLVLLLAKK